MAFHKKNRLESYDYNSNGVYFLTICTDRRNALLSRIVARGILDAPEIALSQIGRKIEQTLHFLNENWKNIDVHNYVIMPNHVHLLVEVKCSEGASRMPRATGAVIPSFVSSLKRFTSKNFPGKLWQKSYYDHIVRDEEDYCVRWEYISNNPARWIDDEYYCKEDGV